MTILRIHKKQNSFVILDKTCLNEKKLSFGAKGLHAFLISMPHDWEVRVSDLRNRSTNGRDAVRAFLNELGNLGYIKKSMTRSEKSGQFRGMEYLVLETPDPDFNREKPEPKKPSLAIIPETENPFPEKPRPGSPTLININRINNNKTAAAIELSESSNALVGNQNAAAVFEKMVRPLALNENKIGHAVRLSKEEALIQEELTSNQIAKVELMIAHLEEPNKEALIEEICYSLLNPKHFTSCGMDFMKKLNAIRLVIQRGDWQTPAEMLHRENKKIFNNHRQAELQQAHAEVAHFRRLLSSSTEATKEGLQAILKKSQMKLLALEQSAL